MYSTVMIPTDRRRLAAATIGLLLATAITLASQSVCRAQSQGSDVDAAQLAEKENQARQLFQALEEAAAEIPRDSFDLDVIVNGQPAIALKGIGQKPDDLFQWVRDNTYLVPYRGALRDSQGVLMDRLGNSLDRALLLLGLLQQAGQKQLRLAYAELSDEQAKQLLRAARPVPGGGARQVNNASAAEQTARLRRYADKYELDHAQLQSVLDVVRLKSRQLSSQARQRTEDQTRAVAVILKRRGVEIPTAEDALANDQHNAIEALKNHWWLQWHNGDKWVDYDPSLPTAIPDEAVASGRPQRVVAADQLDKLNDQRQIVQIRVVIERYEEGKLVELPVLSLDLFPAAFVGRRMAIHHAPTNWPKVLNVFEDKQTATEVLKKAVLAQREWIPILSVGDKRVARYSFTDAGQINDPKLPGFVQAALAGRQLAEAQKSGVQKLGGRLGNLLGGRGGLGVRRSPTTPTPPKPGAKSQLTAEWIEFEIRVPGQSPKVTRRQIFDLIGPAARENVKAGRTLSEDLTPRRLQRGLALLGQTEILIQTATMSSEFVEHLTTKRLLADRDMLTELVRAGGFANPAAASQLAPKLTPTSGRLLAWALARWQWSQHRDNLYLGQPTIVCQHTLHRSGRQQELVTCVGLDIVTNGVSVRSTTSENPFLLRLAQGVLDTNAEASLLPSCRRSDNTAELFAESMARGSQWTVTTSDQNWRKLKLPSDARSRIQNELAAGYVGVVPEKPIAELAGEGSPRVAWWRIDPKTGETLGLGDYGWGQVTVESLEMLSVSIAQVDIALTYVGCLNKAVAGGVDGAAGLQMANARCLAQTYKDKGHGYGMGLVRDQVLGSLGAQIYDLVSGAMQLAGDAGGC